jgi:hypothetical protein
MGNRARYRFVLAPWTLEGLPPGWARCRVVVTHANTKWYAATDALPVRGGAVAVPELAFTCHVAASTNKVCPDR